MQALLWSGFPEESSMTLTLVHHSPCPPALYGAMAATVAFAQDAILMHLPIAFDSAQGADSMQMVASSGSLVPSGLLWYERLTDRQIEAASHPEEIVARAGQCDVVVPWDDSQQSSATLDTLITKAEAARVSVCHLKVGHDNDSWYLHDQPPRSAAHERWGRDAFGRWTKIDSQRSKASGLAPLRVALVGTESDQKDVYPATLAALGDAADAIGLDVKVHFVDPQSLGVQALTEVDGIVLPGGSDMNNVPGQIRAARYGLESGTPVLGLCLGMQSMTTALAQSLPGLEQANMAEAAPDAPIKSFVPMAGLSGLEEHRLGDRRLTFKVAATEQRFQSHPVTRCNHRFFLNPDLVAPLETAGMIITATDTTGQVVDAMTWPHHVFYQGMQGHPEQSSTAGKPHPLIEDFMRAALRSSAKPFVIDVESAR
jgi:CTP synthase